MLLSLKLRIPRMMFFCPLSCGTCNTELKYGILHQDTGTAVVRPAPSHIDASGLPIIRSYMPMPLYALSSCITEVFDLAGGIQPRLAPAVAECWTWLEERLRLSLIHI